MVIQGSSVELAKVMSSVQSHQTSIPIQLLKLRLQRPLVVPQDAIVKMCKEFDKEKIYCE